MMSEKQIREIIKNIEIEDSKCPTLAHKRGGTCFDFGHAMHGTNIAVLQAVLGEGDYLKKYEKVAA